MQIFEEANLPLNKTPRYINNVKKCILENFRKTVQISQVDDEVFVHRKDSVLIQKKKN